MISEAQLEKLPPSEVRLVIRDGMHHSHTANLAPGFMQANLVILPAEFAADFRAFCLANPKPCPLLEMTAPGDYEAKLLAPGSDLRTDLPAYRIWEDGVPVAQATEVSHLWRDDLVSFLIGCSFSFDNLLARAHLPVRHRDLGLNVPMFRTNRPCVPAGRFQGNMVVSMRPFTARNLEKARELSGRLPLAHGEPIHSGDPSHLGIADILVPDFGDGVPVEANEIPVFWACGVTPQLALEQAKLPFAITHKPGHMFITDYRDADLFDRTSFAAAPST